MPRTQCRNRHVPDGLSPRTGTGWAAQAPNAGCVGPSTGARCGKAARRDLRGGREVTPAPTATSGAGNTPRSGLSPLTPCRSSRRTPYDSAQLGLLAQLGEPGRPAGRTGDCLSGPLGTRAGCLCLDGAAAASNALDQAAVGALDRPLRAVWAGLSGVTVLPARFPENA